MANVDTHLKSGGKQSLDNSDGRGPTDRERDVSVEVLSYLSTWDTKLPDSPNEVYLDHHLTITYMEDPVTESARNNYYDITNSSNTTVPTLVNYINDVKDTKYGTGLSTMFINYVNSILNCTLGGAIDDVTDVLDRDFIEYCDEVSLELYPLICTLILTYMCTPIPDASILTDNTSSKLLYMSTTTLVVSVDGKIMDTMMAAICNGSEPVLKLNNVNVRVYNGVPITILDDSTTRSLIGVYDTTGTIVAGVP